MRRGISFFSSSFLTFILHNLPSSEIGYPKYSLTMADNTINNNNKRPDSASNMPTMADDNDRRSSGSYSNLAEDHVVRLLPRIGGAFSEALGDLLKFPIWCIHLPLELFTHKIVWLFIMSIAALYGSSQFMDVQSTLAILQDPSSMNQLIFGNPIQGSMERDFVLLPRNRVITRIDTQATGICHARSQMELISLDLDLITGDNAFSTAIEELTVGCKNMRQVSNVFNKADAK